MESEVSASPVSSKFIIESFLLKITYLPFLTSPTYSQSKQRSGILVAASTPKPDLGS